MIEAKNKREFLQVLNLISEEAVRLSRKSLNENSDPYVKKYSEQFTNDQKKYGSLSEQEEEDDIAMSPDEQEDLPPLEDEGGEEEPADDAEVDLEDEPAEEEAEGEEEEADEEASASEFGVSFDSVLSAINNLRAGKSLKDTNIKDQASAYYDRLDDPERKVLLVFLKQLAEILSGALQGSDAMDPSDQNLSVTDDTAEDEAPEDEGGEDEAPEEEEDVITDDEPAEDDAGEGDEPAEDLEGEEEEFQEEDTSPPIKVNERQDLTELRKRIKRLMLRG